VLSLMAIAPAVSGASTVIGSPLNIPNEGSIGVFNSTFVQTALPEPSAQLTSPVDGTVVQWSLRGTSINIEPNIFKLRVLKPVGNGTFTGAGTSAEESTPHTGSNDDVIRHFQTALPIRVGDEIGLSAVEGADVPAAEAIGATSEYFEAVFPDGSSSGSPTIFGGFQNRELLFNAEVVAAPTSSATVPACVEDGRVAVQISTDPSTTPKAVLFRVDGGAQQSASATAGTATVTIPAGRHTLEYWAEDEVPQQEVGHHSATLQVGDCNGRPALSGVSQTHATWREGGAQATFSRRHRPPVGTTFSFVLNEKASVSFAFTRKLAGRKVKGKCVAPTSQNRHGGACKRTITQGSLSFPSHSGKNRVRFQGRLSASRKLPPGRYTLVITASNSAGQRSRPKQLSFTIVR
jgi:hypothetical protein